VNLPRPLPESPPASLQSVARQLQPAFDSVYPLRGGAVLAKSAGRSRTAEPCPRDYPACQHRDSGLNDSKVFGVTGSALGRIFLTLSLLLLTHGSWGVTRAAQVVGWGNTLNHRPPSDSSNVVALVGGPFHVLALTHDRRLIGWGCSEYGASPVPSTVSNV
jgi:hypothetical protein